MKISTIFASFRAPFFTGVIIPVILGSIIAWNHGATFNWGIFFLALFGAIALHAGANTINDYFDHKSSNDELNKEFARPFTGGSRLIQNALLTPRGMLTISIVCYALGIATGLYLTWLRGLPVLWIGLIGVACGVFYVMPGINLARNGFGEFSIFVAFGLCTVTGAYYVQAQTLGLEVILASVPVALLITAILWINEFPDFNADKAVGKTHWVVRMGRQRASLGYTIIMLLTYLSVALIALLFTKYWLLIALLTAPIAWKASRNAMQNYDDVKGIVPSCAGTIVTHLFTGLLLSSGYVLQTLL